MASKTTNCPRPSGLDCLQVSGFVQDMNKPFPKANKNEVVGPRLETPRYRFLLFITKTWEVLPSYIDKVHAYRTQCMDASLPVLLDELAKLLANFVFQGLDRLTCQEDPNLATTLMTSQGTLI